MCVQLTSELQCRVYILSHKHKDASTHRSASHLFALLSSAIVCVLNKHNWCVIRTLSCGLTSFIYIQKNVLRHMQHHRDLFPD